MDTRQIHRISSISEYHKLRGLPAPEHPLVSLIHYADMKPMPEHNPISWIYDFYSIGLKKNLGGKIIYGQQVYDFDEGTMFFIAPGQVFKIEVHPSVQERTGWVLLIHPDFLWNYSLAAAIKKYEYFGYSVNEALFLSEKEEQIIAAILQNISQECRANTDSFSQQIIISHIEVLLNYADRFYNRQFISRRITNHQLLDKLNTWLDRYFDDTALTSGLPTVQDVAKELNVSPDYLSSLLKVTTGQNTQHHIHEKLIEKAKEKLSTTKLSVSEIAYTLGFEHSQSFSKFFKHKTSTSPVQFRQSLN